MTTPYNGTTDHADYGYSTHVHDLNIFYDVGFPDASHCVVLSNNV